MFSIKAKFQSFYQRWFLAFAWSSSLFAIYFIHLIFAFLTYKTFHLLLKESGLIYHPLSWFPSFLYTRDGYYGWDAAHFKNMFESYYLKEPAAWPPLYPISLIFIKNIFRFGEQGFQQSAVIVNALSHVCIVWGLYSYLKLREPKEQLNETTLWIIPCLVLFFPGHNVFFSPYSESLYLAMTIGVFILREKQKFLSASILAGLSSLVRNMGAFLLLALFLEQCYICIKERKLDVRILSKTLVGWGFFFAWMFLAKALTGQSIFDAQMPWLANLLLYHIPAGENPILWVLKYIALPGHKEWIYFWFSIITIVYCWIKKRHLEALYIAVFLGSFFFRLYRPFPFSRFVSVLFPISIMYAEWFKHQFKWQLASLFACIIISHTYILCLYLGIMGEP